MHPRADHGGIAAFRPMPTPLPLNPALAELLNVLGEENAREIVRTFLQDSPHLLASLSSPERSTRHRAAHTLKSSARLVGAETLAERASQLERQLAQPQGEVTPAEITALAADLSSVSPALVAFAGE